MRAVSTRRPVGRRVGLAGGRLPLLMLPLLLAACESRSPLRIRPGPVIQNAQRFGLTSAALDKIVVVPFHPAELMTGPVNTSPNQAPEPTGWESAELIGRFVSEALSARGYAVIPPSDVVMAFESEGVPVPRLDPYESTGLAARKFGASSVLLGRVIRFREREGSAMGATRPASVAFDVTLYEVPSGRRLFTGRFDETQRSITANVFRARQLPGGGTRWLTAAELAKWGADEIAAVMKPIDPLVPGTAQPKP